MGKKVVVGMSGGVDSSVAAYLLKEQGYEVIGVTMQIWQSETQCEVEKKGGCCGISAVEDARRVAEVLDIPYYVMNFRAEFKRDVIDYFVREYRLGRTPNPCIACNRYVKWEALLTRSLMLGADYIATGHYARVLTLENGRYALASSKTAAKDQSYALYNLTSTRSPRCAPSRRRPGFRSHRSRTARKSALCRTATMRVLLTRARGKGRCRVSLCGRTERCSVSTRGSRITP